jgi:hypothetical protein
VYPSSSASQSEQQRARRTIEIFDLNREQACRCRRRAFRNIGRATSMDEALDYGYRFLIPLGLETTPGGAP